MDKKRLTQELQELRQDIKVDAERKLAAVDVLLKHLDQGDVDSQESLLSHFLSSETPQSSPARRAYGSDQQSSANGHPEKINLAQEVREAVHEIEGSFTQRTITQRIREKHSNAEVRPANVSNTIMRLAKRGYIRRVRKGYGSQPNTYRKTETWPPPILVEIDAQDEADMQEDVAEEYIE